MRDGGASESPRPSPDAAPVPEAQRAEDAALEADARQTCTPDPTKRSERFTYSFDLPPYDPQEVIDNSDYPLHVDVELAPFDGVGWFADAHKAMESIAFNLGHSAARAVASGEVNGTVRITLFPGSNGRADGDHLPWDMPDRLARMEYWGDIALCGTPDAGELVLTVTFKSKSREVHDS